MDDNYILSHICGFLSLTDIKCLILSSKHYNYIMHNVYLNKISTILYDTGNVISVDKYKIQLRKFSNYKQKINYYFNEICKNENPLNNIRKYTLLDNGSILYYDNNYYHYWNKNLKSFIKINTDELDPCYRILNRNFCLFRSSNTCKMYIFNTRSNKIRFIIHQYMSHVNICGTSIGYISDRSYILNNDNFNLRSYDVDSIEHDQYNIYIIDKSNQPHQSRLYCQSRLHIISRTSKTVTSFFIISYFLDTKASKLWIIDGNKLSVYSILPNSMVNIYCIRYGYIMNERPIKIKAKDNIAILKTVMRDDGYTNNYVFYLINIKTNSFKEIESHPSDNCLISIFPFHISIIYPDQRDAVLIDLREFNFY